MWTFLRPKPRPKLLFRWFWWFRPPRSCMIKFHNCLHASGDLSSKEIKPLCIDPFALIDLVSFSCECQWTVYSNRFGQAVMYWIHTIYTCIHWIHNTHSSEATVTLLPIWKRGVSKWGILTLSEPTYFEHFDYPQKVDDIQTKRIAKNSKLHMKWTMMSRAIRR